MWYVFGRPKFLRLHDQFSCGSRVLVFRVDSRCELPRHFDNIPVLVLYSPVTCVHVEPAQPTPNTAPLLPCETHPAQRLSITLLRGLIKGFWGQRRHRIGDCRVFIFCILWVLKEGKQSFKDEEAPTRSWGGNRSVWRSAVRVSQPETPWAESAADSASV